MNRVRISLLALALLTTPLAYSAEADTKIGTVDMEKALQTVKAGKRARGELEKFVNGRKDELKKEEESLKKLHAEFQKQSIALSAEARQKKQVELQTRVAKLQQRTAQSQVELQKREQELTGPIIQKLRGIISRIAKDKGYNFVLEKNENTVLYSPDQVDLTEEVIKLYDKENKV